MKKLLLALALLLAPSLAWGQCNGVFPAASLCGTGAGGVPGPVVANAFPFGQLTIGGLTINPATGATVPGLTINQVFSGAVGFLGNAGNLLFVSADTAQAGSGFINVYQTTHVMGGAATTGGRQSNACFLDFIAATNASNPNRNYICSYSNFFATSSDGGTNTGAGAKGAGFGLASWSDLQNGATNWLDLGPEFDISIRTGASSKNKHALALIDHAVDVIHGASLDTGLVLSGQTGAVGLNNGITFSDYAGQHMVISSGTLINTTGGTFVNGIDWSASTFSGNAINVGTNSIAGGTYKSGAASGLTVTKTVRAAGGAADCNLVFTGGLLTGGTC